MANKTPEGLLEEIKKLMILDLIARGVNANVVADVLGVSKSTISGIVPAKKIKKVS